MPAEDKTWFRVYSVFYKADPALIEALEELLVRLQNRRSLTRSGAVKAIFDAGVSALAEDIEVGSPILRRAAQESRLIHAIALEAQRLQEKASAFSSLGPLGILEVAARLGIEKETAQGIVDECQAAATPGRPAPASQSYKVWLLGELADGEPRRHQDVIQAAVEANLIPGPVQKEEHEKAASLLRYVASQTGVSGGRRGWWQLPQPPNAKEGEKQDPF